MIVGAEAFKCAMKRFMLDYLKEDKLDNVYEGTQLDKRCAESAITCLSDLLAYKEDKERVSFSAGMMAGMSIAAMAYEHELKQGIPPGKVKCGMCGTLMNTPTEEELSEIHETVKAKLVEDGVISEEQAENVGVETMFLCKQCSMRMGAPNN